MREITCDWVRDRLPDRLDSRLDDIAEVAVTGHLATCDECRAEALVLALLRTPVAVPAGLETRVLRAVRSQRAVTPLRFRSTRHLAMAATVAFALITASLLARQESERPEDGLPTDTPETAGLVWSAYEDPLLPGGAGLHALSVAELELVLQEME